VVKINKMTTVKIIHVQYIKQSNNIFLYGLFYFLFFFIEIITRKTVTIPIIDCNIVWIIVFRITTSRHHDITTSRLFSYIVT